MRPIPYSKKDMWSIRLRDDSTGEIYTGEYVDMRLKHETIPSGLHAYNCRHGDNGNWVDPVTIEKGFVLVNFAGTFLSDKEIEFSENKNYICVSLIED